MFSLIKRCANLRAVFLNDRRIDCHDHKSASIRKQRENECWTKISNGTPLQKRAH